MVYRAISLIHGSERDEPLFEDIIKACQVLVFVLFVTHVTMRICTL